MAASFPRSPQSAAFSLRSGPAAPGPVSPQAPRTYFLFWVRALEKPGWRLPSTRMEAPNGSERRVGEAEAAAGHGAGSPRSPPEGSAARPPAASAPSRRQKATAPSPPRRWCLPHHGGGGKGPQCPALRRSCTFQLRWGALGLGFISLLPNGLGGKKQRQPIVKTEL